MMPGLLTRLLTAVGGGVEECRRRGRHPDPGTVVPAGTLRPESLLDDPTTELVAGQAGKKLTSRALRIKHVQHDMLSVLGDDRAFSRGF